MPEQPRVLVVGKDARTDAMADALSRSEHRPTLVGVSEFSAPGLMGRCESFYSGVDLTDTSRILEIAESERPDLVVIGPEEPLAAGVVDELEDKLQMPCFGPRAELAQIESSKSWARQLVDDFEIEGNPNYWVAREAAQLSTITDQLERFVVKPDGLTGGKGVKLSHLHFESRSDAVAYAQELVAMQGRVLIEEVLDGEEFSLQTITDGHTALHTPLVQDHKRAFDGDTGPNTGGMGSYSCADGALPFLTESDVQQAKAINERVVTALEARTGRPYRGVLYGGFIATASGVRLIEYNCRFGDPEAMNVLPLLEDDFLTTCWDVAHGQLQTDQLRFKALASVCRYLVPDGYPTQNKHAGEAVTQSTGSIDPSTGRTYWAAVQQRAGQTLLTGSRAVACVGFGEDLAAANEAAAQMVDSIEGPLFGRSDIGSAALIQRRIDHMRQLRPTSS